MMMMIIFIKKKNKILIRENLINDFRSSISSIRDEHEFFLCVYGNDFSTLVLIRIFAIKRVLTEDTATPHICRRTNEILQKKQYAWKIMKWHTQRRDTIIVYFLSIFSFTNKKLHAFLLGEAGTTEEKKINTKAIHASCNNF